MLSFSTPSCRMARVGWKLGLLVVAAALSVVVGPSEARLLLGECLKELDWIELVCPARARVCSADDLDCVLLITSKRHVSCVPAQQHPSVSRTATVVALRPEDQLQPVTLLYHKPSASVRPLAGPAPYLQCGGCGGECKTPGAVCQDVAWPDFRCPGNFVCGRINAYYW